MKNHAITYISALAAAAALAFPLAVNAAVPGETQIRGTITAIPGKYDVHVQDRRGDVQDVTLHQGTIINPTGLTLKPGMRVTILGNSAGGTFNANEIDTPYHVDYIEPIAAYGPGFGYGAGFGFGPYLGGPFFGPGFGGWF